MKAAGLTGLGTQEATGRARPHARRPREDQRPGPHVPAGDGHGPTAHPRGRGPRSRSGSSAARTTRREAISPHAHRHQGGHGPGRRPRRRARSTSVTLIVFVEEELTDSEARPKHRKKTIRRDRQDHEGLQGLLRLPEALRQAEEALAELREGQVEARPASHRARIAPGPDALDLHRSLQARACEARIQEGVERAQLYDRRLSRYENKLANVKGRGKAKDEERTKYRSDIRNDRRRRAAARWPGGVRGHAGRRAQALPLSHPRGRVPGAAGQDRARRGQPPAWWCRSRRSTPTAVSSSWTSSRRATSAS